MIKNNWIKVAFEDVAELKGGGTPSRKNAEFFGDFIDWATPSDLLPIGNVHLLGTVKEGLSQEGLKNSSANMIPPNSVLFSSRASIGKIAVTNRECTTNQGFINFIPKDRKIDTWFLAYLLANETPNIVKLSGETTYKEISKKKIRGYKIRIPEDIEEQGRIVTRIKECLNRVDEIQTLREDALKEAYVLTNALYNNSVKKMQWPNIPIGELVVQSKNGRSIRSTNDKPNGSVLTLSAVHDVILDVNQYKPVKMPGEIAKKYSFKEGDVFVSRSNTIDLVGLSSVAVKDSMPDMIYPDLLIKLIVNSERILPKYLAYSLRFSVSRDQIRSKAKGTSQSMVKISGASLKEITIPLPPLNIQEVIIDRLDDYHKIYTSLKKELRHLSANELKKAILKKAFSRDL